MTDYEAIMLAGIPNAPSVYSLTKNPELAKQRQKQVINKMIEYKYLHKVRQIKYWSNNYSANCLTTISTHPLLFSRVYMKM